MGKTAVAHGLALRSSGFIVSADSMLIYRDMDIGTAKPCSAERANVRYAGLNLANPDESFSVWDYHRYVTAQLAESGEDRVIVTGGTGLYVNALIHGLDIGGGPIPEARARWEAVYAECGIGPLLDELAGLDPDTLRALPDRNNPRRVIRALERARGGHSTGLHAQAQGHRRREPVLVGLHMDPELLRKRIRERIEGMFTRGLVQEVAGLQHRYPEFSRTAQKAIGYEEVMAILRGEYGETEAKDRIARRTWRLARKQRTWFRHQANVEWVHVDDGECCEAVAERVAAAWQRLGPFPLTGT